MDLRKDFGEDGAILMLKQWEIDRKCDKWSECYECPWANEKTFYIGAQERHKSVKLEKK